MCWIIQKCFSQFKKKRHTKLLQFVFRHIKRNITSRSTSTSPSSAVPTQCAKDCGPYNCALKYVWERLCETQFAHRFLASSSCIVILEPYFFLIPMVVESSQPIKMKTKFWYQSIFLAIIRILDTHSTYHVYNLKGV